MSIIKQKPPDLIAERCQGQFDLSSCEPCYTYGKDIFNPSGNPLDPSLIAHESVHTIQQGEKPKEWWDKFFKDKNFRLDQELQAYRVQYKTLKQLVSDRNELAKVLASLAADLSGPQYGNLCSFGDACKLIRG